RRFLTSAHRLHRPWKPTSTKTKLNALTLSACCRFGLPTQVGALFRWLRPTPPPFVPRIPWSLQGKEPLHNREDPPPPRRKAGIRGKGQPPGLQATGAPMDSLASRVGSQLQVADRFKSRRLRAELPPGKGAKVQ